MSTRRSIDELSLAELERLVLLRRREERLRRLQARGIEQRELPAVLEPPVPERSAAAPPAAAPRDRLAFLSFPRRRRGARTMPEAIAGRSWRERLLLLVEIVGLAGLAIATILFVADLRRINAEAADAQSAALKPPAVGAQQPAILPGGSQPPPAGATVVPAIYREWIEPAPESAVPVGDLSAEQQPVRIRIPAISVDAPVVRGDDWESLKKGAGHHIGSAAAGERGNMVISAHNDIFGEIFRDLNRLKENDEIQVFDSAGRQYRYRVKAKRIVTPEDVSVLEPSTEPIVTLITCHPYLVDTERLIVIAELES
jgi:sortase A